MDRAKAMVELMLALDTLFILVKNTQGKKSYFILLLKYKILDLISFFNIKYIPFDVRCIFVGMKAALCLIQSQLQIMLLN
jgi:hypothetical protein